MLILKRKCPIHFWKLLTIATSGETNYGSNMREDLFSIAYV